MKLFQQYAISWFLCLCFTSVNAFSMASRSFRSSLLTKCQESTTTTPSHSDQDSLLHQVFPVVSQIQGINWEGTCRYVNNELQPQTQLKLSGGTRFDLELSSESSVVSVTVTSFLVFPDGRTRQVQMKGSRRQTEQRPSTRLDPTMEDGPIYMVLTEVQPDTILLNEVEKETGRIILTSTISLVPDELIQSSHEIGRGDMPLEGHQLWRFRQRTFGSGPKEPFPIVETDNAAKRDEQRRNDSGDYRGTTGR